MNLPLIYVASINVLIGILLIYQGVKDDTRWNLLTGGIVVVTGVFMILIETGVLER